MYHKAETALWADWTVRIPIQYPVRPCCPLELALTLTLTLTLTYVGGIPGVRAALAIRNVRTQEGDDDPRSLTARQLLIRKAVRPRAEAYCAEDEERGERELDEWTSGRAGWPAAGEGLAAVRARSCFRPAPIREREGDSRLEISEGRACVGGGGRWAGCHPRSGTLKSSPGQAGPREGGRKKQKTVSLVAVALPQPRGEVELTFQLTAPTTWARCLPRLRTNNRYPGGPVPGTRGKAGGEGGVGGVSDHHHPTSPATTLYGYTTS